MPSHSVMLVRADASAAWGVGHVMRTLALAQAWERRGGVAAFASAECPPKVVDRIRSEGFAHHGVGAEKGSAEDARSVADLARELGAEWVAADGYGFGAEYQEALIGAGLRVLAVDDYGHAERWPADVVLNQNVDATPARYAARGASTRLLLGTRYALLRREFVSVAPPEREEDGPARRLLVTLGGGDPDNATGTILDGIGLVDAPDLEVRVLVGGANPHRSKLEEQAARSRHRVTLTVDERDVPGAMRWADAAVTAGGSTCWELCYMGLPALTVVTADNQRGIAAGLDAAGATRSLGWHADVRPEAVADALRVLLGDGELRRAMGEKGRALVDGRGADRVAAAMAGEES